MKSYWQSKLLALTYVIKTLYLPAPEALQAQT